MTKQATTGILPGLPESLHPLQKEKKTKPSYGKQKPTRRWTWAEQEAAREKFYQAHKLYFEQALAEPLPPGMFRPYPRRLFTCNQAGLDLLAWRKENPGKRNIDRRPIKRPADQCLHHRPHRCFHHTATEISWVFVQWHMPLLTFCLPTREMQPLEVQHHYQSRFCCSEAAYLFAEELSVDGMVDVCLVQKDFGWRESVEDYADRFYGLKPCWQQAMRK
ncbi:MAG: hypothetical protein GY832_11355 [Chloroflexi bacterium]|nr:hypothetical protein [Chloroflexota bacterium]